MATVPISLSFLPNTSTRASLGMRVNRVFLFRALPYEVRPGENLVLEGSGFSKGSNKIYFNGTESATATSTNGTSMNLTVPGSLVAGEYKISISNILGSSENASIPIYVKVTNNPQPAPLIERVAISGDVVTVMGKNFSPVNTVITTLGNSTVSITSDGTALSFRLNELSQYVQVKKSLKTNKYKFSLWIFVQNEHGISKDPYKLDMVI